ncbi:MAG: ATP-binding protein [Candidatus Cloacimonetes bacterium]|nr:ATP-binding protein [Candidatus Cloacimonadota bacterium]
MLELDIAGKLTNLKQVREQIDSLSLPEPITCKINVILDELVSNIIRHGYQYESDSNRIYIWINITDDVLMIHIEDHAHEFNPLKEPLPSLENLTVDTFPADGLGLLIVNKLCERMIYKRENSRNRLTLHLCRI